MKLIAGLAVTSLLLGACTSAPSLVAEKPASASALTPAPAAAPAFAYELPGLAGKTRFGDAQVAALAQPFVGVRTTAGVQKDLYPLKSTGVSTEPVRLAAEAFLATLTAAQAIRTHYGVEDSEWRRWSNVANSAYVRQGTSLKEMTPVQRAAAMKLLQESLSARGLALTDAIRKTDQSQREINDGRQTLDEDLYFFTLMGIPSPTEPWGWQVEGHHLVINYFVLGDQVVMTPTFVGGEPAIARTGKYAGNDILQDEQSAGLALMRSLDTVQRRFATLDSRKTGNTNMAEANKDNLVLDYSGAPASAFNSGQKQQLLDLIGMFVGNLRDGHAKIRMDEVAAHLDSTWFGWVGDTGDDAVFYYRIHSPVILIEFDHQLPAGTSRLHDPSKPTRDHIHVIIRTPNGNDYGKDLLSQHLADHPH